MPPPPDPRPTNLFVPSKRASSGRNPPPPPAPPPGRAPHRPPAAAYNGSTSSTSSYNGRPTADAGYGPTSHPPSSNGGRSTVANPFRPPAPTGAPAPRRRASGAFDRGELAAKTRLAVTDLMGVVRDLRDDAHEAAQFRFPLDGPDGDALAAKVADQRARDAAERKAVIDEGHARLTASALDLVRAVVDGVSSDAIARPSRDLDELRDQVRQLMSQTRTDPAPAASTPARPTAPAPAAPDPALVARLEALERWQRQRDAPTRAEFDQVKLRLAALEETARKSVDPRVRPGSHSSPASPVLSSAPPSHALVAIKSELEALKGVVDGLSQRVERDPASPAKLGKRSSDDAPAGEPERAVKVQRVGVTVEAFDELSARVDAIKAEAATAESVGRFSERTEAAIDALDERFVEVEADVAVARAGSDGALEQALDALAQVKPAVVKAKAAEVKVDGLEVKVGALETRLGAVEGKGDDMDLERGQGAAVTGLDKLEKRLSDLGAKFDTELGPIKARVATCADVGASAAKALKSDVVALSNKVDSVTNDINTVKRRSPSPAPDAPTHPAQLLAAIQQLDTRLSLSLVDSKRAVLDVLRPLVAATEVDLPQIQLEERLSAKVREWDGAAPAMAAVKGAHVRLFAQLRTKFDDLGVLTRFLEESAFPELQQLCDLVWSWHDQGYLPDAAWALVHEDKQNEDEVGNEDEGMEGVNGGRVSEGEADDDDTSSGSGEVGPAQVQG